MHKRVNTPYSLALNHYKTFYSGIYIHVGVENISFRCGRAEEVLPALIKSVENEEPLAIVDPPRAGLSK